MQIMLNVLLCCSGGKDSCFNLMHCVAEGHELVALANLRPADKGRPKSTYGILLSCHYSLCTVICTCVCVHVLQPVHRKKVICTQKISYCMLMIIGK